MPDLQSNDDTRQRPTNPQSNYDPQRNSNGSHNTPLNPASHNNTGLSTNSTSVPETIAATPSAAAAWVNDANQGVAAEHATILPICQKLAARVNAFLESEPPTQLLKDVQNQTKIAMGVIAECLDRYSLEQISLSYNGGKDCLVLLILLLATLSSHPTIKAHPSRLQSVYIISPHPFPEVTTFVASSITDYKLDLAGYVLPMKEGFARYLEEKGDVRAILVGTRRTDPHGGSLTHFDQTDSGWPSFMRVHPVIDWHYREIWGFIRHLEIPYCPLYDRGYTSLGGTTDTHPNPALKDGGKWEFRPAYELQGEEADKEERLGRDF